ISDPSVGTLSNNTLDFIVVDNDTPPFIVVELPEITVDEDTPITFSTGEGNEITITDEDADTQTVTITVTNGTLTLTDIPGLVVTGNGTGSITITGGSLSDINAALEGSVFTPDVDFIGEALITVTTLDECGATDSKNIVINLLENRDIDIIIEEVCLNDVPYVRYEVTPENFTPTGLVTIIWSKVSGEVVSTLTDQPMSGTLLWPGAELDDQGNAINWPGWELRDGIWIQIEDGLRPEMLFTIRINPEKTVTVSYPPATPNCAVNPNNPPVALDFTEEVTSSEGITSSVVPFTSDPDNDPLVYSLITPPNFGELTFNPDGTFTYVPERGFSGEVTFVYQVCDDRNPPLCDQATVTLIISPTEGVDPDCSSPIPYACADFPINQVVTANFDSFNDIMLVKGIEFYPNNRIVIYNRWGNLVWEGTGYDNINTVFEGVGNRGNLANSQLPDGTYFYVIERRDGTGYPPQKGFIHLQR
uniref:T9SS type B sorting domain-containing protein n=1 Tax=Fulvivirga sp. TaxID=1931237 RepID=UPI00404A399F